MSSAPTARARTSRRSRAMSCCRGSAQALLATNTDQLLGASASGCVPLNLFGPEGSITPEMADFISDASTSTNKSRAVAGSRHHQRRCRLRLAVGGQSGRLRGRCRISASIRRRRSPTCLPSSGRARRRRRRGSGLDGGSKSRRLRRIIAPLVTDRPFFESLTLEAGIRYSDYKVETPGNPTFNTTT